MKRIELALFAGVTGLVLASGIIHANPCVAPKRMVRGYTVDLQPLMNWWQEPKGVRPLLAWKHVQGSIVRDTFYGWVVEMKQEGDGRAERFLLKNPPRERLRRFQRLLQELAESKSASADTTKLLSRPVYSDWYTYYLTRRAGQAQSIGEYREVEATLAAIHQRMAAIRNELAPMQDAAGQFKVDAFALKCDQSFEGLPLYDYGSTAPFGS
jgi:hypothetical protein